MLDVNTVHNDVLIGRNGHLFLANGGHAILEHVTGAKTVSSESIGNFWHNIAKRREHAVGLGTEYLHVVYPDKQTVLKEFFPIDNPISLGELYLKEAPAGTEYDHPRVLFPV